MILKENNAKKSNIPYKWIFGALAIIGIAYFLIPTDQYTDLPQDSIVCDAETTIGNQFVTNGHKF